MKEFIACLAATLLMIPAPVMAARQIELRWSELAGFVVRGEVRCVLPDGTLVRGRALAVDSDALVVQGKNGRVTVPRKGLTTIELREMKGSVGRAVLTTVGVIAGISGAMAIAEAGNVESGADWALLSLAVGTGIGGYYAGKAIDRKTTLIRILPD